MAVVLMFCFGIVTVYLWLCILNTVFPIQEVPKKDKQKEAMVELLGRIYNDSVCYNGHIQWDTRQKLNDWVNG